MVLLEITQSFLLSSIAKGEKASKESKGEMWGSIAQKSFMINILQRPSNPSVAILIYSDLR